MDVQTAVINTTVTTVPLVETVAVSNLGSTTEVDDGSTISSIYLAVEALTTSVWSLQPAFYMIVFKDLGNDLSDPQPNLTGTSPVKRQIIHQEMVMLAKDPAVSNFPRTIFKGAIRIPPRLKRFGYADKLFCLMQGIGTGTAQVCVQCIYKEFR